MSFQLGPGSAASPDTSHGSFRKRDPHQKHCLAHQMKAGSNGPIWMRCTASCGSRFPHGPSQSWEPNLTPTCMAVWPTWGSSILPIWRPTSDPKTIEKAKATECGALQSGRGWEGSGHGLLCAPPAASSAHRSIRWGPWDGHLHLPWPNDAKHSDAGLGWERLC